MNSTKIDPKYITKSNPRIGLIALASDFMIERDFINVIKDREVDFFVNRIECYNPLTKENLIKMSNKVTEVTKDILPDQDIDCVVYGCTRGCYFCHRFCSFYFFLDRVVTCSYCSRCTAIDNTINILIRQYIFCYFRNLI